MRPWIPTRRAAISLLLPLLLLVGAQAADAKRDAFGVWLEGLRAEALERSISPEVIEQALAGLEPVPRVIELDRRQPESILTLQQYLDRILSPRRVETGRQRLAEHRPLLEAIGKKYGVQPRFIVALWGIETNYGRITGNYPVVAALATLAYDGRRSDYFRGELLNALRILDQGHIHLELMTGSWAGAMGQVQFMPSSFLRLAVDADGDGRRDIWSSKPDIFASAANYLSRSGWHGDQTWGRQVRLPQGFDEALLGLKTRKDLAEWQRLGVRRLDGSDLPRRGLETSLIRPDGPGGDVYAVYDNYRTLLKWNRSTYFATAVGILADRVGAP